MEFSSPGIQVARDMDRDDALNHFRNEFYFADPGVIYPDGNSPDRQV